MKVGTLTLICALTLAACGGGKAKPKPVARVKPGEHVVSQTKGMALPIGASQPRVLEGLGTPAAVLESKPFRCFVYKTDAGPDTWLRMCFKAGRMIGVATITGRSSAMHLTTTLPKGNGKLRRPKSGTHGDVARTAAPVPTQ